MTAKEIFQASCKNFEDWGITPYVLAHKDMWIVDSFDRLKELIIEDLHSYSGSLQFTRAMVEYAKTIPATRYLWLPYMYTVSTTYNNDGFKVHRLLGILYLCAKEGLPPFKHAASVKSMSALLFELGGIKSIEGLYYETNRILCQGLLNEAGAPIMGSGAVQNDDIKTSGMRVEIFNQSCDNFSEWGIITVNMRKRVQGVNEPLTEVLSTLQKYIEAHVTNSSLKTKSLANLNRYNFELEDAWAQLLLLCSVTTESDTAAKQHFLEALTILLWALSENKKRPVQCPREAHTFNSLRSRVAFCNTWEDFVVEAANTMAIITPGQKDAIYNTQELNELTKVFEIMYKAYGMKQLLLNINSAVQTMPEATIKDNFLSLLKSYMDAE